MTYQEFNHIYFKFTQDKKGVRPYDSIQTTGYELKEFLDFAIEKHLASETQQQMHIF